jgi:hypothetical protein
MATTSNIDDVIDSVDDVKDDIPYEFRKRVGAAMEALRMRAEMYVLKDANYTGDLLQALDSYERPTSDGGITFAVGVDMEQAPHAAVTEFGSGSRTNEAWRGSASHGMTPDAGSAVPLDFPFEAPDIPYNKSNEYDISGYSKFAGFVNYIQRWMEGKGIAPESGDTFISAVAISVTIIENGNYAHPYLRPAWFDTELYVKRAARNAVRNATR